MYAEYGLSDLEVIGQFLLETRLRKIIVRLRILCVVEELWSRWSDLVDSSNDIRTLDIRFLKVSWKVVVKTFASLIQTSFCHHQISLRTHAGQRKLMHSCFLCSYAPYSYANIADVHKITAPPF
jgi:hypothetical protein